MSFDKIFTLMPEILIPLNDSSASFACEIDSRQNIDSVGNRFGTGDYTGP